MNQPKHSDQSDFDGSKSRVFQERCQLVEDSPEDSGLDALPKNLNSRGVVDAINLAAHQPFGFFFVKQSQTVRRLDERARVDLVIRADNRRHLRRLMIDRGEPESVAELCMAPVVPPQRFDTPDDSLNLALVGV